MNQPPSTTAIHAWHQENGARMVPFAGYDMPLHYTGGILAEHRATRTSSGLFDVSHMGRLRFRGSGAEAYLARVLTSDVQALAPGSAQYAFLANERGRAIDDVYLYRLATDDFLLVVNAANRHRDLAHLETEASSSADTAVDETDLTSMFALQGPDSERILAGILDGQPLPEPRRNAHRGLDYHGARLLVARTGYTGEKVCFEIFTSNSAAQALWSALVDAGAVPVGLGARDSLRTEAGLPLYGHELGDGNESPDLPIFTVPLARFGVRKSGGDFIGARALESQRDAAARYRAGEFGDTAALEEVIVPLRVEGSRRPVRPGFEVHLGGKSIGTVTSGASVPVEDAGGASATVALGLARIRADVAYQGRPLPVTVSDGRGKSLDASILPSQLPG